MRSFLNSVAKRSNSFSATTFSTYTMALLKSPPFISPCSRRTSSSWRKQKVRASANSLSNSVIELSSAFCFPKTLESCSQYSPIQRIRQREVLEFNSGFRIFVVDFFFNDKILPDGILCLRDSFFQTLDEFYGASIQK